MNMAKPIVLACLMQHPNWKSYCSYLSKLDRRGDRFDPRYDPRGPDPRGDYRGGGGPIREYGGRPGPYDRYDQYDRDDRNDG